VFFFFFFFFFIFPDWGDWHFPLQEQAGSQA